jgi:hypothetical protein
VLCWRYRVLHLSSVSGLVLLLRGLDGAGSYRFLSTLLNRHPELTSCRQDHNVSSEMTSLCRVTTVPQSIQDEVRRKLDHLSYFQSAPFDPSSTMTDSS